MNFLKFHPAVKIAIVILFSTMIFLIDKLPVALGVMLVFLVLRTAVKVPFMAIKRYLPLAVLVLFIIFMQMLFGHGEKYIVKAYLPPLFSVFGGSIGLKWEGLITGLMISCRLIFLLTLMRIFTAVTSPHEIARGLTSLGFNYRAAFVISGAFNLIPVFEEEARNIINAQKLRGMYVFEKGSFFAKLKAYPSLVVPLMLTAMRKARFAAIAMDTRAFGAYRNRTWLPEKGKGKREKGCPRNRIRKDVDDKMLQGKSTGKSNLDEKCKDIFRCPTVRRVKDILALVVCFSFAALALFLNYWIL